MALYDKESKEWSWNQIALPPEYEFLKQIERYNSEKNDIDSLFSQLSLSDIRILLDSLQKKMKRE